MVILNEVELKKLQAVELEILLEIDRICKKNHIYYSLTGGTLLGAVRHGGFIPWDDDADVSMLRTEYQKFQKACKRDLNQEKFYFQDIENTEGYRWGYGKLRRRDSIFLRENQSEMPYEQGIFVDIFPRDGVPDGKMEQKIHSFLCFLVRKIMWSAVGRRTANSKFQKCVYALFYKIPDKTLRRIYCGLYKKSNLKKTELVRALTFPLPNHLKGYKRVWYQRYTKINFEGHEFQVEASYKEWLEQEFGDYMKLPAIEKRKIHPVTEIKFPGEMNLL
ncbi:MAG: LicD family protein [Lachnospiraceae bacterium]|nr:LicD family protein [Lachnospiraceae bacterium]